MVSLEILSGYCATHGLRMAISPLHDQDKKADHIVTDGEGNYYEAEYKKPHYHIMIVFGNTTTYNNVLRHCQALGCVHCQSVSSILAMYRYLQHLDEDPNEKFIYNRPQDIIRHINGFDLTDYVSDDPVYSFRMRQAIEKIIIDWLFIIRDYFSLVYFLKQEGMIDEYKYAVKEQKYFSVYISGAMKRLGQKIDQEKAINELMTEAGL